jgi:hypothetical protein
VFVTLHDTAGLADQTTNVAMLEVRPALKSCAGIFVHAISDVNALDAFGIKKRVNFLPSIASQYQPDQLQNDAYDHQLMVDYFLKKMRFAIACSS